MNPCNDAMGAEEGMMGCGATRCEERQQDAYTLKVHAGAYGVGVEYVYSMVQEAPQSANHPPLVVAKGKGSLPTDLTLVISYFVK